MNSLANTVEVSDLVNNSQEDSAAITASDTDTPVNVTAMPLNDKIRTQDLIVKLMLEGKNYHEIASFLNTTEEKVKAVAKSEWVTRELTNLVKSAPDTTPLEGLIRVQAYEGIVVIGELLRSEKEFIRLQAAKLAISYVLTPQRDKDFLRNKERTKLGTPAELESAYQALMEEKLQLESKTVQ